MPKQDEPILTFVRIIRTERKRASADRRRILTVTLCEYRAPDGTEYRKSFESYNTPNIPTYGTSKQLTELQKQW